MCTYHAYINLKWYSKNMHFPVCQITLKDILFFALPGKRPGHVLLYIYDNKEAKLALPLNWITNY